MAIPGLLAKIGTPIFNFSEELEYHFLQRLYYFTFPPAMHIGSNLSMSLQTLVVFLFFFFVNNHPNGCGVIPHYDEMGMVLSACFSDEETKAYKLAQGHLAESEFFLKDEIKLYLFAHYTVVNV